MTKTYRKIITTQVQTVLDKMICELCGQESTRDHWGAGSVEIDSVTILHREGHYCVEGRIGVETEIDICPDCFRDKLMPWFESQGVIAKETDWD